MRLPNGERAVVDPAKIRDYLLSPVHPVGRFKAAFFRALGYGPEHWKLLQDQLLEHAETGVAEADVMTSYGSRFRVGGIVRGPNGRSAAVVSVWLIAVEGDAPRLITVFPGGRS